MKNIYLLLLAIAMMCSCKVVKLGNTPLPNPAPYVLLKNGNKIPAAKVEETISRIEADGKRYAKIDVRGFCDGINTFLARKGTFYQKAYEGKVDIYKFGSLTPNVHVEQERALTLTTGDFLYFAVSGNDSLIESSYKNLKLIIAPTVPAYKYLQSSKTNRRISTYKVLGAVAMFIGGAALLLGNIQSDMSIKPGYVIGGTGMMVVGGFGGFLSAGVSKTRSRRNLMEAVGCYNEVWPETKTTK